jgi:hypothetical protein
MDEREVYLGDGAYAEFDGYAIVVTARNGVETTDTITLEPEVFAALLRFAKRFYKLKIEGFDDGT